MLCFSCLLCVRFLLFLLSVCVFYVILWGFFGSSLFGVFGGPEKGRLVWVFVSAWRVCFGDEPSFFMLLFADSMCLVSRCLPPSCHCVCVHGQSA